MIWDYNAAIGSLLIMGELGEWERLVWGAVPEVNVFSVNMV